MNGIVIKKASPGDAKLLASIGRETFFESFADKNSVKNMADYLGAKFSERVMADELANPGSHIYFAWDGDEPAGYLKLNTGDAQTELQETDSLEVERIYVRSAWQGKKIGQLLFEKAMETARDLGKSYIWLGVWEENPGAIRFYEKNGFAAFGSHIFMIGDDAQTDIMMRKTL